MIGSRIFGTVVLVGGGMAVVAAILAAPKLLRVTRPMVREALKRGMESYARARTATSEFVEDVEDLIAEVQAELTHERPSAGSAAAPTPPREANGA